jgi:hypothetical protein
MTYACPAWELAAEIHVLKLQRIQNKVFCTIGNFPRRTSVRDMHVVFHVPYVYDYDYDYITKISRKQGEIIHNRENEMYAILDKAKPNTENIRGLNLAAVIICTTVQVSTDCRDSVSY